MAPWIPFVQVGTTSNRHFLQRRIWNGGEAPVITHQNPDGTIETRLDLKRVPSAINKKAFGISVAGGFFKSLASGSMIMGTSAAVSSGLMVAGGAVLGALGMDDDDIDDLRKTSDAGRSLLQVVDAYTFVSNDLVPMDMIPGLADETANLKLPSGYGVPMLGESLGSALAWIALGGDPSDAWRAWTRLQERNFLPFIEPDFGSSENADGLGKTIAYALFDATSVSPLMSMLTGREIDGRAVDSSETGAGIMPGARGASVTASFGDNLVMRDALLAIEQTLREHAPINIQPELNGRYASFLLEQLGGTPGKAFTAALRAFQEAAMQSPTVTTETMNPWLKGALSTAGVVDNSAASYPTRSYYEAVAAFKNSSVAVDIARFAGTPQERAVLAKWGPALKRVRQIIGKVNRNEGEWKKERQHIWSTGDTASWARVHADRQALYLESGDELRAIVESIDGDLP